MVDRLTGYMNGPGPETVEKPLSQKSQKKSLRSPFGRSVRSNAVPAVITGVAQIISTAAGSPTAGQLIDALAFSQHSLDMNKSIVVSTGDVSEYLYGGVKTTPSPERGRNQEQEKREDIFPVLQVSLGSLPSHLRLSDYQIEGSETQKWIRENSAYKGMREKMDAVCKFTADQLKKTPIEFFETVTQGPDGEIIIGGVCGHETNDERLYALYGEHVNEDGKKKGILQVYRFAGPEARRVNIRAWQYNIKNKATGEIIKTSLVPVLFRDSKAEGILEDPTYDAKTGKIAPVGQPTKAPPGFDKDIDEIDVVAAKMADAGDAAGPSDWEKAGVSREVYMSAMSEALNILHPDLHDGVLSGESKFSYERNGFVDSKNRVWRKGVTSDNDPGKGWRDETDKTSFTFKDKNGKDVKLKVVSEMDTELGIGVRRNKDLDFTEFFENGKNENGQGVIPFLEKYGHSELDGKTIRFVWVSERISSTDKLNGSFVLPFLVKNRTVPTLAFSGTETGNDIQIRIYNLGDSNPQIDAKTHTGAIGIALLLAVTREYGNPQTIIDGDSLDEFVDSRKTLGIYPKTANDIPPSFVKLSNTPPAREGVKISSAR